MTGTKKWCGILARECKRTTALSRARIPKVAAFSCTLFFIFNVVGVRGFEPRAPCSQSRCSDQTELYTDRGTGSPNTDRTRFEVPQARFELAKALLLRQVGVPVSISHRGNLLSSFRQHSQRITHALHRLPTGGNGHIEPSPWGCGLAISFSCKY